MDVAAFIGSPPMNLIEGELEEGTLSVGAYRLALPEPPAHPPGPVTIGIRPGHIALADEGMAASLYLSENLG